MKIITTYKAGAWWVKYTFAMILKCFKKLRAKWMAMFLVGKHRFPFENGFQEEEEAELCKIQICKRLHYFPKLYMEKEGCICC